MKQKFKELGLEPEARLAACSVGGVDPLLMGIGPCEAIPKALKQAGLKLSDIEQTELNEAFCCSGLSRHSRKVVWIPTLSMSMGGAVAMGHPLGCTGAKLTIQLLNEMKRRNQKYGMVHRLCGVEGKELLVFLKDSSLNFFHHISYDSPDNQLVVFGYLDGFVILSFPASDKHSPPLLLGVLR